MTEQDNVEKKIKRYIYGKPQSVIVTFPSGFAALARDEVQSILSDIWFQSKFTSEVTLLKNAIRIDNIHLFAVTELLMRGQCFSDIRLIVSEGKTLNMTAFEKKCHALLWDFYVTQAMTFKIKVDAGGSPALHEGAMKEIISRCAIGRLVSGEDADETTTIYADIYKYQLTLSISLAGAPLYKRGYRSVLSNSAPLREDIAAACIHKALQFGLERNEHFVVDDLLVPFSGTGTFLFEYLIGRYQYSPVLFGRKYALQAMPLFRVDNFNYLLKMATENCSIDQMQLNHIHCIDHAESANESLLGNMNSFKVAMNDNQFVSKDDFLQMDVSAKFGHLKGNIFIPLNPPYGIRLGKSADPVALYQKIADQVKALAKVIEKKNMLGFILCPSEETWSGFCKVLSGAAIETYHINQGGLDIRVAQFFI